MKSFFDLSDNYVLEEVAPETYVAIGGIGTASLGTADTSTITASFQGAFDYCVLKSELKDGAGYRCAPDERSFTRSANRRIIA